MPAVKGSEIRERRRRTGVKLGPFARAADVNYKTLANVECGSQKVASFEFIVRVARALPDTQPEELIAGAVAEDPKAPTAAKRAAAA